MPILRRLFAFAAFASFSTSLAACFMPGENAASKLAKPPEYNPANQTKCSVKKSTDHPLIVEWPSADRATLEAKAQSGLVAVRYIGCEMEVLHRCKLPGKYAYTSITPKRESVAIKDQDELYAKMPVGAAKLEATLARSGQLDVSLTIVGRYEADRTTFTAEELDADDCSKATHVVAGMTTGAFELSTGTTANVGGGIGVAGVGAGGSSGSSRETLERDGRPEKCETAGKSEAPPDGCGAVLRLDVVPIEPPKRKAVAIATPVDVGTDERGIAPALYEVGNLRVAVRCAESEGITTPEQGLRVFIDGSPQGEKAVKTNALTTMGTQTVNNRQVPMAITNFTDVGFLVAPGQHKLRVEAPDCAALETDVRISGTHPVNVVGDMEVTTPSMKGPVGAPWGGTLLIGGYAAPMPLQLTRGSNSSYSSSTTNFTVDGTPNVYGGFFGFGYAHRNFYFATNYYIGHSSYSGTLVTPNPPSGEYGGPFPFTGSQFEMMLDLRFGARVPLHYVALMGGSGIGGSMWISSSSVDTSSAPANAIASYHAPTGLDVLWHLPLWVAADLKPACNWGVQVGGAYNVQPTHMDGSHALFHAALLYQPSPSCSRVAEVSVSP